MVYLETSQNLFRIDFILRDQLRRLAVSFIANIAEGFGRRTDKEFANFLNVSLVSLLEIQANLYVGLDLNYISKDKFDEIYHQTITIQNS